MNESQSFRQNVNRLLLGENALLKDETNRLLEATLSKSPIYNEILQELSTYKYGVRKYDLQEKLKAADVTIWALTFLLYENMSNKPVGFVNTAWTHYLESVYYCSLNEL